MEGEAFNRSPSGLLVLPHSLNAFNWNIYSFFEGTGAEYFFSGNTSALFGNMGKTPA